MSRRHSKMGDRGFLFFMVLFLVLMSWSQVIRQMNGGKARFDPWRLEPAWEREHAATSIDWPALPGRDSQGLVLSLDRREVGRPAILYGTAAGHVFAEDAEGRRIWEVDLGEPVRSLKTFEWDGDPAFEEIAVGGERGTVFVLDSQGERRDSWDDWGEPIEGLVGADLDGDGREDLAAATAGPYLQIFRQGQESLTLMLAKPATRLAAEEGLLVVGFGKQAQAYRLVKNNLIEQYRPMLGSLIFTLVAFGVILPVMLLHPRLEIGAPSPRR